jgi:hypothetical protein
MACGSCHCFTDLMAEKASANPASKAWISRYSALRSHEHVQWRAAHWKPQRKSFITARSIWPDAHDDYGGDIDACKPARHSPVPTIMLAGGSIKVEGSLCDHLFEDMARDFAGFNQTWDACRAGRCAARACVEAKMYKPSVGWEITLGGSISRRRCC